jgi:hypothetical protein
VFLHFFEFKMAQLKRSIATLRIMGDELIPDEITRILGCEPSRAQSKGEELIGHKTGSIRIAKIGMWRLDSAKREPENLDDQIEELLCRLNNSVDIWTTLSNKFKVDMFCGLFLGSSNEGLSISPKSLSALGARGIELDLDIYGFRDEVDIIP